MSKIIGVTVGTPLSANKIKEKANVIGQISTHNTDGSAHSDIRTAVSNAAAAAANAQNTANSKEASGTAAAAVSGHNTASDSHNDIRLLVTELTNRLNALANSTDVDLDQMAELVAYIKDNRELIEQITTNKVSVSDIINNLTTNVSNKPLSAAQGVALKALADAASAAATNAQNTANSKEASGTAASAVSEHNSSTSAHSDIRTAASNAASAASTAQGRADAAYSLAESKLAKDGDGSNVTAAFSAASSRANIGTGEKLSVIFGKIAKWFADLKTVAFTGSYNDLGDKPTIPTTLAALTADATHRTVTDTEKETWNAKSNFSGSYNDLSNKPTIPSAYTHPSSHPASMITGLATVATSGSYNDLSNKPTIPSAVTVDSSLSSTSTNPVQNKVVNTALSNKQNKINLITATIGTNWVEDSNTGIKTQTVSISGITADVNAKVDNYYNGNGSSDSYSVFVEQQNQFLDCITNGFAETVAGGIKFTIFGDANTVNIPIIVEVV